MYSALPNLGLSVYKAYTHQKVLSFAVYLLLLKPKGLPRFGRRVRASGCPPKYAELCMHIQCQLPFRLLHTEFGGSWWIILNLSGLSNMLMLVLLLFVFLAFLTLVLQSVWPVLLRQCIRKCACARTRARAFVRVCEEISRQWSNVLKKAVMKCVG